MAQSIRHLARGIEAVIDSAHVVHPTDVWVDSKDTGKAINQICKLMEKQHYSPSVYTGEADSRVCIRIE